MTHIVVRIVRYKKYLKEFLYKQKMAFHSRVLSIQSHVVSGYVGNKSAVFPMQLLGLEVDFVNSVQLSTHTGYKCVKGQILSEKDLADLVEGLVANNIDFYTHLLTGYIGSESFLKQVVTVVKQLKEKNPDLVYVCDPVMGDHGKLYVPKELVPIYKETVLSLANIITPNLYETELLTDMTITNSEDLWKAIEILHQKGCQTVVISSAELGQDKDTLSVFASTKGVSGDAAQQKLSMQLKKLPINFIGTGDLFAALFLSWMHKSSYNLKESLEKTIATLQAVLKRTVASIEGDDFSPRNIELKLVQSKLDIEEPKIIQQATVVQ